LDKKGMKTLILSVICLFALGGLCWSDQAVSLTNAPTLTASNAMTIADAEVQPKEKMLIRYIIQTEFITEVARLSESRATVARIIRKSSVDELLARLLSYDGHEDLDSSTADIEDKDVRTACILHLGIPTPYYDFVKVKNVLRTVFKKESDI
jgi:hypothetical protein